MGIVNKKMEENTGREYAQIASCFLNHDCRSAQVIEHDVKFNIHHDYRRRNVKMKAIVPNSTFLSVFDKQPDLTKNNGITSLQIQRSVEREPQTIPLLFSSQSFNFLSGKTSIVGEYMRTSSLFFQIYYSYKCNSKIRRDYM